VTPNHGRYKTKCDTPPCHRNSLGTFDSPEEAAQTYLQHWEKEHPEELKKERVPRPVLLPVQEHLLIRSDKNITGYNGVVPNQHRYQARCFTSPCRNNYLGHFDIPEEAAQAYLQHYQKDHPEQLKKERVPRPVLLPVQEHLLIRSDTNSTGFIRAGTRLHAPHHPATTSTSAPSTPQRRQLRRTCSTTRRSIRSS
jgi:hypothetical protein